MTLLLWIVVVLNIIANILVIRKNKWGFAIWVFCNLVLLYRNFTIGEYQQFIQFLVYFWIALFGFLKWHFSNPRKE